MRHTSAGDPSKLSRSFSKISTPSNPAAAAASSFSGSVPDSETVAMDLGSGLSGRAADMARTAGDGMPQD